MNKFLRFLFILVILAMTGAIIFQLFFPNLYGKSFGLRYFCRLADGRLGFGMWRFWSSSLPLIIKYDWFYLRAVLLALILGGLGIGTNHFLSYLQHHHSVNAIGAFENYLLVLGWIVGWWLEVSRIKKK